VEDAEDTSTARVGSEDRGEESKTIAVVALARKMAGILFAIWRDELDAGT
jgi:hypothetical protein